MRFFLAGGSEVVSSSLVGTDYRTSPVLGLHISGKRVNQKGLMKPRSIQPKCVLADFHFSGEMKGNRRIVWVAFVSQFEVIGNCEGDRSVH